MVADAWQRRGLGTRMMNVLMDVARSNGLKTMNGYILAQDTSMLRLMNKLASPVKPLPRIRACVT